MSAASTTTTTTTASTASMVPSCLEDLPGHGGDPEKILKAYGRLNGILSALEVDGIPKDILVQMIRDLASSDEEKDLLLALLEKVDTDIDGKISKREWFHFIDETSDEVMKQGHGGDCGNKAVKALDSFGVVTWHDFKKYEQVSWVGAGLGIAMRLAFVGAVALGISDFVKDTKTTMRQEFKPNPFEGVPLGPFFVYFRDNNFENIFDETLFTFDTSYYIKSLDQSTNEAVEDYQNIPTSEVSEGGLSWWPEAVTGINHAVVPDTTVVAEGAYHLPYFKQLQVQLKRCDNATISPPLVCQPIEEIDRVLNGASVNFVFKSPDEVNPAQVKYWSIRLGETKQIDLWFDLMVRTITGKIPYFDQDEVEATMHLASSTEQTTKEWGDGTLAVWWFSQAPVSMHETRVRQDVTGLLGEFGGTWASLLGVFGLGAYWWNRRLIQKSVENLRLRARFIEDLRITCSRATQGDLASAAPSLPTEVV